MNFAFFSLLFCIFYPPIFAYRDESLYLGMAYVLKQGTLFIEKSHIPLATGILVRGHEVPFYPIGHSLLLLPFIFLNWKSIFLLGLFAHLFNTYLFSKLAKIWNADASLAALLFLYFPPFIFYSRTIMSDLPSLSLFLLGFLFYFDARRSNFMAGVWMGLSLFFRVSNVIILAPFVLSEIIQALQKRSLKKGMTFCLGLLPIFLLVALYNTFLYGSPFLTGYSKVFTGMSYFSWKYFSSNFLSYFLGLNLIYPLMFILLLWDSTFRRIEILGGFFLSLIFFSFYYFHDQFPNLILSWIFGNRFLFPFIVFMILAFSRFLEKTLTRHKIPGLFVISFLGLCATAGISVKHQQALSHQVSLRDLIYQNTPSGSVLIYDNNSAELLQKVWGERFYRSYENPERLLKDIRDAREKRIFLVIRHANFGAHAVSTSLESQLANLKTSFHLKMAFQNTELSILEVIL